LRQGVGHDHPIDNRDRARQGERLQGMGNTLADHFVMPGVTADQHAQGDHAVGLSVVGHQGRRDGHFVRTRDTDHGQVFLLYARGTQARDHAVEQTVGQFFVVTRSHDGDAKGGAIDD
jgi:hypothetical protein